MGKLKPVGSEKLTGDAKIQRIIEIARFKENIPNSLNETAKSEYNINLPDGNRYEIVKEKQGYIVKRTLSESQTEYIEPMKNRKYYSSYSQALKRLNLLAAEINRITENEEGVSLFGEDKKFVLKTPKPQVDEPASNPPAAPPPIPSSELPPSPISSEMGDDLPSEIDDNLPTVSDDTEADFMDDEDDDIEVPDEGDEEQVSFRTIQKLTGKLTQKLRTLDNEEGMTSENIKYVINMVLSSVNLNELSEEDKEDIIGKFDDTESSDEFEDDMTSDTEVEDIQTDMDVEPETEMTEKKSYGSILDSIFSESKVDKVLSKYFEFTKKEINEQREKRTKKLNENKSKIKEIVRLSESVEQEIASAKFLEENSSYKFIGKSNKKNLVFESKGNQVRVTPEGFVI